MARISVGQRVKFVGRCDYGNTGIVVSSAYIGPISGDTLHDVAWDRAGKHGCGTRHERGAVVAARADLLEPILPEGHKAGDYSFTELMDSLREGVSA